MRLSHFQDAFAAALWHTPSPSAHSGAALPDVVQHPAFAVYRNTVTKGCIDALQANYPTVCALVGEAWFRAAAHHYAQAHPPQDARLTHYGGGFATFLEHFGPAAELPYLADVARLDRCWTESHLAADANALDAAWLAAQDASTLATMALRPHPAARWHHSPAHPAFALWQAHRNGLALPADIAWQGDGGLLTRPQGAVQWTALPAAGTAFLNACARGDRLETAALAALAAEPGADLSVLMALLLHAGALAAPSP
ncbi:putative DNA-binding protein [Acidovorax sp. 56]|uniref:HvfC/BufC N-terminal domain-containing protein n=1 Tax=Acidovorax sp. 56 TaxID=2035205 RepID=UPI000C16D708|nr:DNA-binding domain-containing protein [Acidovorax sp. 56]PIF28710.1 putative DNA-binding protein [Acidovorax sp. 56]